MTLATSSIPRELVKRGLWETAVSSRENEAQWRAIKRVGRKMAARAEKKGWHDDGEVGGQG